MAAKDEEQQEFELVKRLDEKRWLARRIATGEEFVARRVDDYDSFYNARDDGDHLTASGRHAKGLYELIYAHNFGRQISQIMNHENLVGLAGYLRQKHHTTKPFDGTQETQDYLVWDFCDAGSLELLLVNKGRQPPLTGGRFMEESLCWHVLMSVMRALTWLHDGYRQEYDWANGGYRWICHDQDWMPILHRDIRAANILFQHPKGEEFYGPCKLTQLSNAFVSGHAAYRWEGHPTELPMVNAVGMVLAPPASRLATGPDQPTVTEMRKVREEILNGVHSKDLYTISDEHWALGAVLFRMMTATFLPSYKPCAACRGCCHVEMCAMAGAPCTLYDVEDTDDCTHEDGACEHIMDKLQRQPCKHPKFRSEPPPQCQQACPVRDVNIDETLLQHDYSRSLIKAVRLLFYWNARDLVPRTNSRELCIEIENLYETWKYESEEGLDYIDVHDDAAMRFGVLNGLDEEEAEEALEG